MRPELKVVLIVGAIALFGVVAFLVQLELSYRRAQETMVCAVGKVWACPTESIQISPAGPATFKFTGCGRDATYYCKMPAEGCMLKDSKTEVLPVWDCHQ